MSATAPATPEVPAPTPAAVARADAATAEGLLRCWVRETAVGVPADGVLRLDLPATGTRVEADVIYWSLAGWHRLGNVRDGDGLAVDATRLATLLATEAVHRHAPSTAARARHGDDRVSCLVDRVAESAHSVAGYLAARFAEPENPPGTSPFLAAEQALLLGHPLHPTPKSRGQLTGEEAAAFSPELRGSFALHWFAADPRVVAAGDSAHAGAGETVERLVGTVPGRPPGTVLVPAHPWQARAVRERPEVWWLLDSGLLHDLGQAGPEWYPTLSVRSVYRPDAEVMLKLSLGLTITNSKRENKRAELRRGAEIDRLLDAGLEAELAAAYPGFGIVRDPAWLAVEPEGAAQQESGLEVVIRDNPFGPQDRVACVAGLVAERPDLGRSGLAARVQELAARTGRPVPDVAEEWFVRYLKAVVEPVLWLYGTYGLGLEAHQQNTLVVLDGDGWPVGGWYRDNQGYYLSARRVAALERLLPGVGVDGDSRCDEEIIDERIGYYLGINNVLGLVGAFGSQRLASEERLLARFRAILRRMYAAHGTDNLRLAVTLAEASTLRCKCNLLTRADGLDELVGPLASQSVYGNIPNPIARMGWQVAG